MQLPFEHRSDRIARIAYSVDASIFEIEPQAIAYPRNREETIALILAAKERGLSLTARGAGTGIAGACLGDGIILDFSRHMNRILDIDLVGRRARVQPGVVQDQLNRATAPYGLRLGPDTSSGNRATLGGMAATNAAGAHSLLFGSMADAVESVELILEDGTPLHLGPETEASWQAVAASNTRKGALYRTLDRMASHYSEEIKNRFPKLHRRASGYALDRLSARNVAKLIVGSEGTLGVITEITVCLAPVLPPSRLSVLCFPGVIEALREVPSLLARNPFAIELLDDQVCALGRLSPQLRGRLDWLPKKAGALLLVEESVNAPQLSRGIELLTTEEIESAWSLRKAGLGLLLSRRTHARAVAFIEDLAAPPEHLPELVERLYAILSQYHLQVGCYGHAGPGCLHIRPFLDLQPSHGQAAMREIMEKATDIVVDLGGANTGEHGDGRLRSWLHPRLFGEVICTAFQELKEAFDPSSLFNPGVIAGAQKQEERLRDFSSESKLKTRLDFQAEGGFSLAVNLCNGNGACRKREGLMCPSFQVTGDEFDTTRARAQALRALANGRLPTEAMASKELQEVLELCLECKGCKRECPSQVDMAKLKSELLYHYHSKHGLPLRERLFAYLPSLLRLSSYTPGLVQKAAPLLGHLLGIAPQRSLPPLAAKRFSQLHPVQHKGDVVLFLDTYTEYYAPHIGAAAIELLTRLGYHPILLPYRCCGRTLLSKGCIDQAERKATLVLQQFLPYAQKGFPIVGLEPSCILTLADDYPALQKEAAPLAAASRTLDRFLAEQGVITSKEHLVHVHCHQRAIEGIDGAQQAVGHVIPSGCCGMAGSFGYEAEHYTLSMAIAEDRLLPALRQREENQTVVACGFSCRSQIQHALGITPLHTAEALLKP